MYRGWDIHRVINITDFQMGSWWWRDGLHFILVGWGMRILVHVIVKPGVGVAAFQAIKVDYQSLPTMSALNSIGYIRETLDNLKRPCPWMVEFLALSTRNDWGVQPDKVSYHIGLTMGSLVVELFLSLMLGIKLLSHPMVGCP